MHYALQAPWAGKLLWRVIGPALDMLAFIFFFTVILARYPSWWITIPGPAAWISLVVAFWALAEFVDLMAAYIRPCEARRGLAKYLAWVPCATCIVIAILAADTIYFYRLWLATDGDVNYYIPMCLVIGLFLGVWRISVILRRRLRPRWTPAPPPHGLSLCAKLLLAGAFFGIIELTSYFPNPPPHRVGLAVVFGADVLPNNTPGAVLRGRLRAAIALFNRGLVGHIMLSGRAWHGQKYARKNEPLTMAVYCLRHHIPGHALVLDYDGNNTRYSVYHAVAWMRKHHVSHVVAVSSMYHLPRIYITFKQHGVTPYTQASKKRAWREMNPYGLLREFVAVPVYYFDRGYHKPRR